jgi:beta-glucosidase/6-phospho-beta-glucosidase/beta-galactosidase
VRCRSWALSRKVRTVSSRPESADIRGHTSDTEPWIVGHSLLIAHATAAKLYLSDFKPKQKGIIGITLNGDWTEPYDDSPESKQLARAELT